MDDSVSTVLSFGVLGFMGYRLVGGVRHVRRGPGRLLAVEIVRGIRWRHLWPVPFVLGGVLVVATVLMAVPGLSWGWWTALGGVGNPVFGSSTATDGTILEWLIPAVFLVLLAPALPLFAHAEELLFRRGAETWSGRRRAFKVLQFGAVHALIGIPIGAALALSVGGAYFMRVYLAAYRRVPDERAATVESARAHTAYNAMIIAVLVVAIAAGGA